VIRGLPGGVTEAPAADFEVGFVGPDGRQVRVGLAEALPVRFEQVAPARSFPSYKRQRHFPGLWWTATVGAHVGYESWLERDHLMLLDFDPGVVGIASQPFWLFWTEGDKRRSHAPDYFARRVDGTAVVVDCRPLDRIKPRDAVAFETTKRACQDVGWDYELVGSPDPVVTANVRWLAGYRHPRHLVEVAALLREVFTDPAPLMSGAHEAGDPIAVLPVLFHLMWRQELVADLSRPLHADTVVVTTRRT
jgi:hypothetical protein